MHPARLSGAPTAHAGHWQALLLAALLSAPNAAQARDVVLVVAPGQNVWNLAQQHLQPGRIEALLAYNAITDPHRVAPGTRLRIPAAWLRRINHPAEIVETAGSVTLIKADGAEIPVQPGSLIKAPAQLRTGPQSGATLHFPDGSRMLVGEESQVRLQKSRYVPLTGERDVRLGVPAGKVENDVAPRKELPGRFEIRTPSGVAAVRGTRFRISSQANLTHAEVLAGRIGVADRRGRQTALASGYGMTIAEGRSSPEIALLKAPQIDAPSLLIERFPLEISVPEIPGAIAYRTLVSLPGRLSASLADHRAEIPAIRVVDLADGDYQLRVRAIDRHGLEGEETVRPLTVNARPPAPFTVSPKPDAAVSDARPTFSWSRLATAEAYHFQLAANPEFSPVQIADDWLKSPEFRPPVDLAEGSFFWRVAAQSAAEGQGPFSAVERFQRVPPAPASVDLAGTPGTVRWAKLGDARYHVQLASNAEFSPPLIDRVIDENQLAIDELPAGTYHLRLQTQGRSGLNSAWSDAQTFTIDSRFDWRYLLIAVPLLLLL